MMANKKASKREKEETKKKNVLSYLVEAYRDFCSTSIDIVKKIFGIVRLSLTSARFLFAGEASGFPFTLLSYLTAFITLCGAFSISVFDV